MQQMSQSRSLPRKASLREQELRKVLKLDITRNLEEWSKLLNEVQSIHSSRACGDCSPTRKQRKLYVNIIQLGLRDYFLSRNDNEGRMAETQILHNRWFELLETELNPSGPALKIWKCEPELVHQLVHFLLEFTTMNSEEENNVTVRQRIARLHRDLGHGSQGMIVCYGHEDRKYGT